MRPELPVIRVCTSLWVIFLNYRKSCHTFHKLMTIIRPRRNSHVIAAGQSSVSIHHRTSVKFHIQCEWCTPFKRQPAHQCWRLCRSSLAALSQSSDLIIWVIIWVLYWVRMYYQGTITLFRFCDLLVWPDSASTWIVGGRTFTLHSRFLRNGHQQWIC